MISRFNQTNEESMQVVELLINELKELDQKFGNNQLMIAMGQNRDTGNMMIKITLLNEASIQSNDLHLALQSLGYECNIDPKINKVILITGHDELHMDDMRSVIHAHDAVLNADCIIRATSNIFDHQMIFAEAPPFHLQLKMSIPLSGLDYFEHLKQKLHINGTVFRTDTAQDGTLMILIDLDQFDATKRDSFHRAYQQIFDTKKKEEPNLKEAREDLIDLLKHEIKRSSHTPKCDEWKKLLARLTPTSSFQPFSKELLLQICRDYLVTATTRLQAKEEKTRSRLSQKADKMKAKFFKDQEVTVGVENLKTLLEQSKYLGPALGAHKEELLEQIETMKSSVRKKPGSS